MPLLSTPSSLVSYKGSHISWANGISTLWDGNGQFLNVFQFSEKNLINLWFVFQTGIWEHIFIKVGDCLNSFGLIIKVILLNN